jgi:hypothetical protein
MIFSVIGIAMVELAIRLRFVDLTRKLLNHNLKN